MVFGENALVRMMLPSVCVGKTRVETCALLDPMGLPYCMLIFLEGFAGGGGEKRSKGDHVVIKICIFSRHV